MKNKLNKSKIKNSGKIKGFGTDGSSPYKKNEEVDPHILISDMISEQCKKGGVSRDRLRGGRIE